MGQHMGGTVPVLSPSNNKCNTWRFRNSKLPPFFARFRVPFQKFHPFFCAVSSTFVDILTSILHENKYNFARKKNPFIWHFKHTFADTPLFRPNQEQTKTHFLKSNLTFLLLLFENELHKLWNIALIQLKFYRASYNYLG